MLSKTTQDSYTISELVKEFGVTSRALRLYEELGLVAPRREGTKRIYADRDRVRLRLILRGKRLACSLSEIKDILDLYDTSSGEKAQIELLLEKLDRRRKILETQKNDVDSALDDLKQVTENALARLEKIKQKSGQSND